MLPKDRVSANKALQQFYFTRSTEWKNKEKLLKSNSISKLCVRKKLMKDIYELIAAKIKVNKYSFYC